MSYIAMMPLRKNVPNPTHSGWQPAYCPICGRECWRQEKNSAPLMRIFSDVRFLCTECALLRSAQDGSGHAE